MTKPARHAVVVHAHFYQPPREDPWLDAVEAEPGAAPFHDWNERIERECYRAVVAARVPDATGRIARIVNTLESISFNAGPTLLSWMERAAPDTYARFLDADRASQARLGHGNALAMPYHHTILPLASRRDKRTEVRWGLADFRRRFGRDPEGMWLPETAVDDETLDVLAEEGVGFTILAPHQVEGAPADGMPVRYTTASGRRIALIVYDGNLSSQVAFGPLIRDGGAWLDALAARGAGGAGPRVTTIATDGETYGHHHIFGEMALARVVHDAAARGLALTNPAALLAAHPAVTAVTLVAPSSWSCAHGVERWRADCGCRMDPTRFPSQAWRAPLRDAMEWLAAQLRSRFTEAGALHFDDPWAARDAMAGEPPSPLLLPDARQLLEMERNTLRMFTSCAWFFDDIGGIEARQCLRYAARAIELSGEGADALRQGFADRLASARSNDPARGTGADIFRTAAAPAVPAAARIAAGHAASRIFPWGLGPNASGPWVIEADDGDGVLLADTRTGQEWRAGGQARRDEEGTLRFEVRLEGSDEVHRVGLRDLPEPDRAAVCAALRAALFPPELAAGLHELGVPGWEALTERLLELLPRDLDLPSLDPALLHGALDLLDLEGEEVPFDAQTRFWELMRGGGPAVRQALGPFAMRFGFGAAAFDGSPA